MKRIHTLLIALALMCNTVIPSPAFAESISENDSIISADPVTDITGEQKSITLIDELNEKRGLDLEIAEIKKLSDFVGNTYYAIECYPVGYAIMHGSTGKTVEFSPSASSPYAGYNGELLYGGPTYYYYLDADEYKHVWYDEVLTEENVSFIAEASEDMNSEIVTTAANKENELNSTSLAVGDDIDPDCILFMLDDADDMGFYDPNPDPNVTDDGVCGYIAAGLLLLWHRHYDSKPELIDGFSYLYDDNSKFIDPDFTKKLRSFGTQDATTAFSMESVIEDYGDSINVDISCYTTVLPSKGSLIYSLKNTGNPIILFGNVASSDSGSYIPHAVLAYGYTSDDALIVHFGHPDKSYVELYYDPPLGSSLSISRATVNNMVFSDLASTQWAYPGAAYCARYGIIDNYSGTSFGPDRPMTRGMFVNALYHLVGEPEINDDLIAYTDEQFTDFSTSYAYSDALVWAYVNNIIVGTTDTQLSPNATVTRQQAVTFLYRFDEMMWYDYDDTSGPDVEDFDDWESISDYAYIPMNWATERYIIQGSGGLLNPKLTMPKKDCATMIYNFANVAIYW